MKTASLRRQTQIGQVAADQGEAPVVQFSSNENCIITQTNRDWAGCRSTGEAPVFQVSRQ